LRIGGSNHGGISKRVVTSTHLKALQGAGAPSLEAVGPTGTSCRRDCARHLLNSADPVAVPLARSTYRTGRVARAVPGRPGAAGQSVGTEAAPPRHSASDDARQKSAVARYNGTPGASSHGATRASGPSPAVAINACQSSRRRGLRATDRRCRSAHPRGKHRRPQPLDRRHAHRTEPSADDPQSPRSASRGCQGLGSACSDAYGSPAESWPTRDPVGGLQRTTPSADCPSRHVRPTRPATIRSRSGTARRPALGGSANRQRTCLARCRQTRTDTSAGC
jgi:hypothetical protein